MRKPTLFACLLLLSLGASAKTSPKNPGCPNPRTCGDPNAPDPLPPPPGTPIIRDFRLLANGETPRIPHKSVTIMPGDPPVIERLKPEVQIHDVGAEFSQNAPPTIRDSQTPMPKPPDPPIVRGSLIQPQTNHELAQTLIAGNFGVVGFAPPDTPIVRGTRIPKQPAPKPPLPPIVRRSLTQPQTNSELAQLAARGFRTAAFVPPDTPTVRDNRKKPTPKPPDAPLVPAAGSKPADPHPTLRLAEPSTVRDFWRQAV